MTRASDTPSTSPTVTPDRSVICQRDQRRIRAAMSRMPYAASERVPTPWVAMGEPTDVDAIVLFLDGLAVVLAEVAEASESQRGRLHELEADLAAFRRILGTAPAPTSDGVAP